MRFVIDECLSVTLPAVAHGHGYEAYHVVHRGLAGCRDDQLQDFVARLDAVLVTNNGSDFLRLYSTVEVHSGLIVVVPASPVERQQLLFRCALRYVEGRTDLVNRIVEIHSETDLREYEWPRS